MPRAGALSLPDRLTGMVRGPWLGMFLHAGQVVLLGLVTGYFTLLDQSYFVLGDDAMISMRYARNLAAGNGLCWNVGECVEGYTNWLWTLLMALPHWLGASEAWASLPVAAAALCAGLLAIWAVHALVERASGQASTAFVAATLAGCSVQWASWGVAGFETSLLALCATLALLACQRHAYGWAAVALAVGVLTRDDFVPMCGVILVANWLASEAAPGPRVRQSLVLCALPLFALLAHVAFRYYYYADLVPNTYHLKVEGWVLGDRLQRGLGYVLRASPALLLAAAGLVHRRNDREQKGPVALVWLTTASSLFVYGAYAIWVGGDAFAGTRLLAPAWPAIAIGAAWLVAALWRRVVPRAVGTALAVGCGFLVSIAPVSIDSARVLFGYRSVLERVLHWTEACQTSALGRYCRPAGGGVWGREFAAVHLTRGVDANVAGVTACQTLRSDATAAGLNAPSMAVYYAGIPAYFCPEFFAIDLLGKSDRHVAAQAVRVGAVGHNKWDYEHSLGTKAADYLVSLLPSAAAMTDVSYRDQPDADYNWHHLLRSSTFWRRCAGHVIDDRMQVTFRCNDRK